MKAESSKEILDKMRGYSSIFSSKLFHSLLQYDDYSFINAKIKRHDLDKLDNISLTYRDYIQYVYAELTRKYRNEYVYKNTFINSLLIEKFGVKDTVVINEFRVGNSIADLVMFNGTSKAFEIKTELDSIKRLNNQLADYTKIFKECYIITHESLGEKYLKQNESIGIIELTQNQNSVSMREIRPAKENKSIDADTLINSIRTQEYKNIIKKYYGELPAMNSFSMFETCKSMMKNIPFDKLHNLFIDELKMRKSNTNIVNTFEFELRQVCFAMHIDSRSYKLLESKLSKKISL